MRICLLTSSRADYSIYLPLASELAKDPLFTVEFIAFGSHISKFHGETYQAILDDGFKVSYLVDVLAQGDMPADISTATGLTIAKFSSIWEKEKYDLVFALGDRYEMFAACAAAIPFNIKIAHLYGGETTLGAIDNIYRACITLASTYHFTSTESYSQRVAALQNHKSNIYTVGALSFDNLKNLPLLTINEFKNKFNIDLSFKTILITFHPETVSYEKNDEYINQLLAALDELSNYQLLITMPNMDTMGNRVRERLQSFIAKNKNAFGYENLGTIGYLSAIKYCAFMLGNTSSGFVEANFFPKFVINLGNRQLGRFVTPNIINTPIIKEEILAAISKMDMLKIDDVSRNIYGDGTSAKKIVNILKNIKYAWAIENASEG